MVQVIANRPRDCLACRIVSGSGLLGISLYVAYQARAMKKNRSTMFFVASVAGVLGAARLFNLPPFNKSSTE